jgi:hypothetical protein
MMTLSEAVNIYAEREVDFTNEVILMDNGDGNVFIHTWNVQGKTKPTLQQLNNIMNDESHTLNKIKYAKILELSNACRATILNGFTSSSFDNVTEKFYSFDEEDQINMSGLMNLMSVGSALPIYWKAKDELISYEWTNVQFKKLYEDAVTFKLYMMKNFHILRQQVISATLVSEVESIVWGG